MREHSVQTIGAITIDGKAVTQSQQVLVSALALARPSGATIDVLVDAAWPDRVPPTARKSIQNQIVRLRREFGADLIVTSGDRYRLAATTDLDAVDRIARFCDQTHLSTDEQHDIAAVLTGWAGEPYACLPEHPIAEAERARLHHLKSRLVETLASSRLTDSERDNTATIVDLTVRTTTDPLHEQAWELLVAALCLAGRRTEALATYARFRTILDSHLGAEPSRRFQVLHDRVLADQPIDPTTILASGHRVAPHDLRATA